MKKIMLILLLCTAMLSLFLSGCAGGGGSEAGVTPLPSPTEGSQMTTFEGKITAKDGNIFTVDVVSSSMNSYTVGATPEPSASSSTTSTASPASGNTVPTSVPVTVPSNTVVALTNGKAGKFSDIKVGKTAVFTMTDSVVTAVTLK